MRVLVLGGSWFLGRLLVADFALRGFDVTVFNRGRSAVHPPRGVRHIRGDRQRDDHLRALAGVGPWNVVVDVSGKVPAVVRRSVRALAEVAERYVFASTVEAYRDWPRASVDEGSPLQDEDPDCDRADRVRELGAYGRAKVGCEIACREAFGDDRLLILRLHAMVGRHEYVGPLQGWLDRMHRGGPVLVPAPDRLIQPVDVRDVAVFLVDQVQRGAHGAFNVGARSGDRTYGSLVTSCADLAAEGAGALPELVWADESWLVDQGVREWTELPLWRTAAAQWHVNVDRAVAAGLRCRPLADTLADAWEWLNGGGRLAEAERSSVFGMDPAREARIIARWRARGS